MIIPNTKEETLTGKRKNYLCIVIVHHVKKEMKITGKRDSY